MSARSMRSDPNIADPVGFYASLVAAHEGLSEADSRRLDARLVLLLANQVGDDSTLLACIAAARRSLRAADAPEREPG